MSIQSQKNLEGANDIMSSVRALARQARGLVEQAGGVAERELAMILDVTEEVRDRMVSKDGLERARQQPLLKSLRQDTHRAVDLAFDAVAVVYIFGVDIVEKVLDRPSKASTPALATPA